jgi:hypothetical protein
VARNGEKINFYTDFVAKPERKRPLGRSQHKWQYKIKMYLKGME